MSQTLENESTITERQDGSLLVAACKSSRGKCCKKKCSSAKLLADPPCGGCVSGSCVRNCPSAEILEQDKKFGPSILEKLRNFTSSLGPNRSNRSSSKSSCHCNSSGSSLPSREISDISYTDEGKSSLGILDKKWNLCDIVLAAFAFTLVLIVLKTACKILCGERERRRPRRRPCC